MPPWGLPLLGIAADENAYRFARPIYDFLELFDGRRPTAEIRTTIQALTGLRLSDSFLTALYQHRILVDPASAGCSRD